MSADVEPVIAATLRRLRIVDIRPEHERLSMGWIPGSHHDPDPRPELIPLHEVHVYACHSGARSGTLVRAIHARGGRAINLVGGLRAWRDAGLPVCDPVRATAHDDDPKSLDRDELVRLVRSCFVVEAVVSHDDGPSVDPVAEFDDRFAPSLPPVSQRDYERRLDRLAEGAWRNGHRLEAIARNIERFYALGRRVRWSR